MRPAVSSASRWNLAPAGPIARDAAAGDPFFATPLACLRRSSRLAWRSRRRPPLRSRASRPRRCPHPSPPANPARICRGLGAREAYREEDADRLFAGRRRRRRRAACAGDRRRQRLAQFTVFDIRSAPVVEWRWKASSLVDGADNRVAAKEDAPARLLFAFDGDKAQLPLVERAVFYITRSCPAASCRMRCCSTYGPAGCPWAP